MKITLDLFEAHLKCPTKCWLRATGESSADNTYAEWVKAQNDSYRTTETERLMERVREQRGRALASHGECHGRQVAAGLQRGGEGANE